MSNWIKTGSRLPRTHGMNVVHALVNTAVKVSLLIPPDIIDLKTQIQVVSLKSTELGTHTLSALGLMNIEHVLRPFLT